VKQSGNKQPTLLVHASSVTAQFQMSIYFHDIDFIVEVCELFGYGCPFEITIDIEKWINIEIDPNQRHIPVCIPKLSTFIFDDIFHFYTPATIISENY
jgi:hypothetical protein